MDRVALLEAIDALLVAARRAAKLRVHRKIEPAFAKALAAFFRSQGRTFLRGFASLKPAFVTEALREADTPGWEAIWTAASAAQRKRLEAVLARYLTQAYRAGAVSSAKALGIAFDLANERAVEWAAGHAATLVSGIEDTTKEALRRIISGALDEGWSYQQTARAIREEFAAFSVARSELIAVTETANAYEQANADQARSIADSGLDMEKAWATVGDNDVEDTCQSNEDEGWIPMDDAHDSGDSEPPAHPNCRCTELYRAVGNQAE